MGSWGVGPLENDAALDLVQAWKRFRSESDSEESATPEQIFDRFVAAGMGDTMDWGDVDTTARLIALAELFRRDRLPIRGKVKRYFEEAINWERRPEALSEWDDHKARRQSLDDLLKRIGGLPRRLTRSKLFRHPAIEFQSQAKLLSKLRKWIHAINENRLAGLPSDNEYPRLWQVLDRILQNQLHFVNDELLLEANAQRLMLLAAYIAIQLQLPVSQALALVEKAKGTHLIMGFDTDLHKRYLTAPAERRKPKPRLRSRR